MTKVQNFIGGELADSVSGATMALVDPTTGEEYGSAPVSNEADIDNAYAAASKAFADWKRTTPSHRQKALLDFADDVEKNAQALVEAEGRNTGKPNHVTMAEEIPPMVDQIRFFAGAARMLEGKSAGEYMENHTSWIRREPVGVIGQVAPWNYPMMMGIWKFCPAIAAGNTVVIKPSDTTPVTTVMLAELAAKHFPPGVLNVVCGDRNTGAAVVGHPTPEMVSITGSVAAGRAVAVSAGGNLKRTHLNCGKAPVSCSTTATSQCRREGIATAGYLTPARLHGGDAGAGDRQGRVGSDGSARGAGSGRDDDVRKAADDEDAWVPPVNNVNQMERVLSFFTDVPSHAGRRRRTTSGRQGFLRRTDGDRRTAAG
jgi:betaine-aldehyde dehydrogenase